MSSGKGCAHQWVRASCFKQREPHVQRLRDEREAGVALKHLALLLPRGLFASYPGTWEASLAAVQRETCQLLSHWRHSPSPPFLTQCLWFLWAKPGPAWSCLACVLCQEPRQGPPMPSRSVQKIGPFSCRWGPHWCQSSLGKQVAGVCCSVALEHSSACPLLARGRTPRGMWSFRWHPRGDEICWLLNHCMNTIKKTSTTI